MSATQEPRQRWVGPFEGYIKGTPKDFTGKTKTTFCKTLEEAQTIAQNYDGIVGGITQIKENKFSLRYGNRLFYSPKKEKSWLFLDAKQPKFVDTSPDLPEDEAEWTRDDHEAYDKWEEEENKNADNSNKDTITNTTTTTTTTTGRRSRRAAAVVAAEKVTKQVSGGRATRRSNNGGSGSGSGSGSRNQNQPGGNKNQGSSGSDGSDDVAQKGFETTSFRVYQQEE